MSLRARHNAGDIEIQLTCPTGVPDIELWGAERRKDLMERTLNRKVRFVAITERK
jgi:hypothetical protein